MFGIKEYIKYADLMEKADKYYLMGWIDEYYEAIREADIAYEAYEYASGLKMDEDYY